MTIYLDLDECLINSIPNRGGGKKSRTLLRLEGDSYWTMERPIAKRIITECRALAPTKILTTATREYTYAINELFAFQFEQKDILAAEDYLTEVKNTYSSDWLLTAVNIDPHSVLVDNNPPTNKWAITKMNLLGITPNKYFQIRAFSGKDSHKIEREWEEMKEQIMRFQT